MKVSSALIQKLLALRNVYEASNRHRGMQRVALRDAGWEVIAGGFYGIVATHPSLPKGTIVKLGYKTDDGWPEYARWCRAHPQYWGHGILPVYYLHRNADGVFVALIKRLREVDGDWYMQSVYSTEQKEVKWEHEFSALRYALNPEWNRSANAGRVLSNPDFFTTAQALAEVSRYFQGTMEEDLHGGNVMVDPDTGRLVVTDPYGESKRQYEYDEEVHHGTLQPERDGPEVRGHRHLSVHGGDLATLEARAAARVRDLRLFEQPYSIGALERFFPPPG